MENHPQAQKLSQNPFAELPSIPVVIAVPTGEGDFLPELHRSRLILNMTRQFMEEMSSKAAGTADARQRRGN
jgi:hypothetical protein